jgi:hypothetical protein
MIPASEDPDDPVRRDGDATRDGEAVPAPVRSTWSELTKSERAHPLFRRGYNMGYSDRTHQEFLAELERRGLRSAQNSSTVAPPRYGVTDVRLRDRLAPGVGVYRDLAAMTEHQFTTETPCCGRQITVQRPPDDLDCSPAVCCRCRLSFEVNLVEEELDGFSDEPSYVAVFTVEHVDVAVARHRAGKWE